MTSYEKYIESYLKIVENEECMVTKTDVVGNTYEEKVEIKSCIEQFQFVEFIRKVFATEELIIKDDLVEKYFSYQKYFDYELFPWEKCLFVLHCCTFRKDGMPRFPELMIYVGRGAGKNGYLAFENFCLLTPASGLIEYDIDICATSEDQAKRTFEDIYNVLEKHKTNYAICKNFRWTQTYIKNLKTGSKLRYRTSNIKTKDGLRSGKVDLDEEHAYEDWSKIGVFTTGLGKKKHPRLTHLSSGGSVRGGPYDINLARGQKILRGETGDNGTLPFICKIDNKDEVHDKLNWYKANPSLQYMPNLFEEYEREYNQYQENVDLGSDFMLRRMNCIVELKETKVASQEDIMACCNDLPNLSGKHCVVGIDYTKTTDFMSVVLLFKEKNKYYAIHHSWFCKNSLDKDRIKVPLTTAESDGYLTIVDDVEIKRELVSSYLQKMSKKYIIDAVAIDSFRYSLLSDELKKIGFDFQNDKERTKLTRPLSDIARIVPLIDSIFLSHNLTFGDDLLMRWFINNTKLIPTSNGNYTYDKIERKSRKNDGFMALVAAMTIEDRIKQSYSSSDFIEPIVWR